MSNNFPISLNFTTDQGLTAYISAVNAARVLTVEEERALALRYREQEDLDAARELVLANLRHVVRVARGFMGYGLPLADLIQEGNVGLMKAVKRFDPAKEVRLVSFAIHWIKAEIYDYVLRNWRIVKVATTKAQRKLFFNLRKSRSRLGWMKNDEVNKLADDLNVAPSTVSEMESRLHSADVSFDLENDDEDNRTMAPVSYIADHSNNPELVVAHNDSEDSDRNQLWNALETLDERSRSIVSRRWLQEGKKTTLHDLAEEYGVSAERIRQIEKRAMEKLRESLVA